MSLTVDMVNKLRDAARANCIQPRRITSKSQADEMNRSETGAQHHCWQVGDEYYEVDAKLRFRK